MLQTLRPALRALGRRPAFTAVAILTLALGLGANAAIFSLVDTVLLRPLPYLDPDRLMVVWQHSSEVEARLGFDRLPLSTGDFADFREANRTFSGLASIRGDRLTLTEGEAERLAGVRVSEEFFDVLGVRAAIGRTFRPPDAAEGRAVVISSRLWARRFGSDPAISGRYISLNGEPAVITGVMPAGFGFPAAGDLPDAFGFAGTPDVWSLDLLSPEQRRFRGGKSRVLIGRLRPSVTPEEAAADLNLIAAAIAAESPATNAGWTARVVPLREQLVARVRPALLILLMAVGAVLLIACANVANLLLVRATARQRELTVRRALGAGRGRLVRELLTESVLLALAAGALGLLLAWWALQALVAASPANLPVLAQAALDARVIGFTVLLSVVTGLVFGMLPAVQATSIRVAEGLRDGARGTVSSRRANRLRGMLVVVEVAVAVVLLVAAALLVQAFMRLTAVDSGFNADRVLTLELSLPAAAYPPPQAAAFFDRLLERLDALPGVEAAGVASSLPLTGSEHLTPITIEGMPRPEPGQEVVGDYRTVSNGYFAALRIPLQKGALLPVPEAAEGGRYALVNQRLARAAWPGQDPIGRRLKIGTYEADVPWHLVVGVVGDTRQTGLDADLRPQVYTHHRQYPTGQMAVVVRTLGDPAALASPARAAVAALDPSQPVSRMRTMGDVVNASVAGRRFQMLLMGAFAALAVILAVVGLYAVIAYSVAERIHEMGLRLALGARPSSLLRLVLADGMKLVGAGVALGLAGAAGLTRLMQTQLFGVPALDPATFIAVPVLLAAVGILGCLVPAWRAMKVDPATALRSE